VGDAFKFEQEGFDLILPYEASNDGGTATVSTEAFISPHADSMRQSWRGPQAIETVGTGDAYNPKVAIDAKGNAMAVWSQYDGARFSIWANRYLATSGWCGATLISIDPHGDAFQPNVVMNTDGVALIAWEQRDNDRCSIWVNRFVPDVGWGSAALLKTVTTPAFLSPILAIDGRGDGLIVSTVYGQYASEIWGDGYSRDHKKIDAKEAARASMRISHLGSAASPRIAINARGRAVLVWIQHDGRRHQVWASRYVISLGWDQPTLIDASTKGNAYDPQVAIDADGNATATWYYDEAGHMAVWTNRYNAATWGWGRAQRLSRPGSGQAFSPRVVADGFGNVIVVWSKHDDTQCRIWASKYSPTTGWDPEQPIEPPSTEDSCEPQVAMDATGVAVAVWRKREGNHAGVWACRYAPGYGWGKAQLIESDKLGKVCGAQIAVSTWGEAIAVWLCVGSEHSSVHASIFG
jgi:hypothetical protein